jgi:hypothetical protein
MAITDPVEKTMQTEQAQEKLLSSLVQLGQIVELLGKLVTSIQGQAEILPKAVETRNSIDINTDVNTDNRNKTKPRKDIITTDITEENQSRILH